MSITDDRYYRLECLKLAAHGGSAKSIIDDAKVFLDFINESHRHISRYAGLAPEVNGFGDLINGVPDDETE